MVSPTGQPAPWLAAFVLVAGCGDSTPAPSPPGSADAAVHTDAVVPTDTGPVQSGTAGVTVSHYDYTLDLATRASSVTLTLQVTTPGDCVGLPFREDTPGAVTLNAVPAARVAVATGVLTACDPTGYGWTTGTTVTLSVAGTLPLSTLSPTQVGYSVRTNHEGHPFNYLLSWVGECDRFGACDTTPSAFATYRFTVDHPSGTRVLCPGVITDGDTRTVCDFTYRGGPTYSTVGVAASPDWMEIPLGTQSGVAVTLYDTATTGIATALTRTSVLGFLAWMTDTFGPYPYGNTLRFAVGPTYWAGFEHPGNIVLADTLVRGGRVDHTAMHETAHQWAGDQTTLTGLSDFAWKESMAEYLSFVYEDDHISHAAGQATAQTWKTAAWVATSYPVPASPRPLLAYYQAAYGPGPMIFFRQLEVMYSRDAIVGALRHLLGSPHALSVDDVRTALETATGAHLTGYMNAWLRGNGTPAWPRATVTLGTPATDGSLTVTTSLATADSVARGCRFTVQLRGAAGETLDVPMNFTVDGMPMVTATVHPTFTVTSAVVDPYSEALVWPAMPATMTVLPLHPTPTSSTPTAFWLAPAGEHTP